MKIHDFHVFLSGILFCERSKMDIYKCPKPIFFKHFEMRKSVEIRLIQARKHEKFHRNTSYTGQET